MDITFEPIQAQHLPLAYSFLRDALKISFGLDPSQWPNNLGNLLEHNYIEIIQKKLMRDAASVVHVWQSGELIGQIESSVKKDDPLCGYVSLYYLVPDKRGLGFGALLDNFATGRLADLGCKRAELTVEATNKPAMIFYLKHGWVNKGLHPSHEDGILMEKVLE